MATSPSGTPSSPNEPPPNNSSSSSSPPELSPPSPPASSSSSSSPPQSSQPHPSPPFSPPPTPSAPPPKASSSPAPPRSQSTPPLPSLSSPAPPQSPAPTRTPDALPIPSTPSPPLESEPRNTSPDATGNSNPPTAFLPPPAVPAEGPPAQAVPAGGPPAPAARRSPPSSAPSRPSSESPNSGNAPKSSVNNNAIIVAGIFVAAILLLSVVVFCLLCTRKKKKQPYHMDAARPPPAMGGDQQYFNGSTEWLNNPQFLQIPPQPAAGNWAAVPPHSPGNLSSEYSAGFSPLPASPPGMGGFNQSQFSYEELAAATAGFSQANLLGQGGFGYVHKGVLTTGKEVAVKSLKTGSGQGEREFQAEVEIISRVHHRHLVSLVGYCIGQGQRMLVYEFVPNKTLEFHLHGKGQPVMDWATRLKIAVGSAKGLAYLHEDCHPRIIHRDIKTANILLDEKFEAMVADFGLAKLSTDNNTHVSTRVMGTFGYLAPEYASSGKLTEKSDVFSYGVMLLELITGRRPVDINNYEEDSLVDWARPLLAQALEDGNYAPLADARLDGNFDQDEMSRMAACAAASIRHSAKRRPKMSQIMHTLEGNSSLDSLNNNPKAVQSAVVAGGANDTQLYDTVAYNADMMKFREMVMSSPEFDSSEYGGNAGENGLDPASSSSSNIDSTEHYGYQVHNYNRV